MANWLLGIETITHRASKEQEALAERWRQEVLIRACIRHRVTFISGMGTYFFTHADGRSASSADEAVRVRMGYLKPLFEVLDAVGFDRHEFGFSVSDVTEKDKEAWEERS